MHKFDLLDWLFAGLVILFFVMLFAPDLFGQDINDPLINGSSIGSVNGGAFSSKGWTTQDNFSYIQYNIPTCAKGTVEFDVTGIYASNDVFRNCYIDKYMNLDCSPEAIDIHHQLFNMWDEDLSGSYWGSTQWHNKDKCIIHIYGYTDASDLYKWRYFKLRLNVNALNGGYDDDPCSHEDPSIGPVNWTKDHIYHFKLSWGDGHMLLFLDGVLVKDWEYSNCGVYAPPYHRMRLGSAIGAIKSGGFKCPIGTTYSNFTLTRDTDTIAPFVVSIEPLHDSRNVSIDSDILVTFSEPMDTASVRQALRIDPLENGRLSWNGSTLCFTPYSLLLPWTPYTVTISKSAKDLSGNVLQEQEYSVFVPGNWAPVAVPLYDQCDILRISTAPASNPYVSTWLKGVFTGPSKTITIDGFWDGGNKFRVRMAPVEVGHWSWAITSNDPSLAASGSFECVASANKGFITAQGYGFRFSDGTEWQWKGDTSWRGYTALLPYSSRWKEYVDLRAGQGYTAMQSIVHSFINGNQFWQNEGGQCFAGTDPADYDHLNPQYFRWIDKRLDYLAGKGMVPIMFFTWAQDYTEFTPDQFRQYVKYLVARYASRNVIWIICGEYNELAATQTPEFEDWGRLVDTIDPYDHPTSLHPTGRTSSGEFGNSSWMNFIGQQTPYSTRDVVRDRQYGKPVVNLELRYNYMPDYGAGPNDETRYELWEITTAGGYWTNGFTTVYAPDKMGWDPVALPDEQLVGKVLNEFLSSIPLSSMNPRTVATGNLLADENHYLWYNRNGGAVSITVSGATEELKAVWIDPKTGLRTSAGIASNGLNNYVPPQSSDMVLYIGPEIAIDYPPTKPLNVRFK